MEVDLPNILKRCSSAPVFPATALSAKNNQNITTDDKTNDKVNLDDTINCNNQKHAVIQDKIINSLAEKSSVTCNNFSLNSSPFHSNSTCSSPVRSREASPAPYNIFAPRARRYSASFTNTNGNGNGTLNGPRLTPRVSQLRQEECVDANSREINHEREIHSAMQISQSWEDLTLVAENWSCKSEDLNNPLQLTLSSNPFMVNRQCSSPSPTSNRAGIKLCLHSPSPTRRTFATRRSMSPIAMRPSQLGPVKRKFELEDGNWGTNYSPPPVKKKFINNSTCGSPSDIFNLPSSTCSSLDSTTPGNLTPKSCGSNHQIDIDSVQSVSSTTSSPLNKDLITDSTSLTNHSESSTDVESKMSCVTPNGTEANESEMESITSSNTCNTNLEIADILCKSSSNGDNFDNSSSGICSNSTDNCLPNTPNTSTENIERNLDV